MDDELKEMIKGLTPNELRDFKQTVKSSLATMEGMQFMDYYFESASSIWPLEIFQRHERLWN